MAHEAMSEQLARLGWKVGNGQLETIESRWADIIGAILKYQQEHQGRSPTHSVIAQHAGLSPGQVQHHVAEMVRRGFIEDRGGWPPVLIVKINAVIAAQAEHEKRVEKPLEQKAAQTAPKEEEKNMATVKVPPVMREPGKGKKRESFLVNAKRFAQALTNYYDEHGEAPMLKNIAASLGYHGRHTAGLSRITGEMVQRGWLHHKHGCQADWVLTGLGRAVLFGEPLREEVHTDMPVRPQPTRVFEPAPRPETRVEVRRADVPAKPVASRGWGEPSPVMKVYQPKPVEPPPAVNYAGINLAKVDSVDLVLELQARGFRVSR